MAATLPGKTKPKTPKLRGQLSTAAELGRVAVLCGGCFLVVFFILGIPIGIVYQLSTEGSVELVKTLKIAGCISIIGTLIQGFGGLLILIGGTTWQKFEEHWENLQVNQARIEANRRMNERFEEIQELLKPGTTVSSELASNVLWRVHDVAHHQKALSRAEFKSNTISGILIALCVILFCTAAPIFK